MLCKSLTTELLSDMPNNINQITFGMGCFWGAERLFWQQKGVWGTAVGYAGGHKENPTYDEVCEGTTEHAEVVLVAYDPTLITLEELLRLFWESHAPTQGMRQGNDVGSQYRSVIFCSTPEQLQTALLSKATYQQQLTKQNYAAITTEIALPPAFYFAEEYHQRYLAKNPMGYCGLRGTGVTCSINKE